eukprot:Skav236626  [mRNA]  locus=scaffold182:86811:87640:- [translate_table: standard]
MGADAYMSQAIFFEHMVNQFLALDFRCNGGHASRVWPQIFGLCYPFLVGKHLCEMIVILALRAVRNQSLNCHHDDFMEVFAGSGNLTLALLTCFSGSAYDLLFHEDHNALTSRGLKLLFDAMGALKRRGLCWFGTKCSSWVVLCRHQSQRCVLNGFLGDQTRNFVVNGNHLMEVTAMQYLLAYIIDLIPVLEQPQSSVMPDCGKALVTRNGNQFTGQKDRLVESQSYTCDFGLAVRQICEAEWAV